VREMKSLRVEEGREVEGRMGGTSTWGEINILACAYGFSNLACKGWGKEGGGRKGGGDAEEEQWLRKLRSGAWSGPKMWDLCAVKATGSVTSKL
jgi:hypothetical protein